MTTHPHFLYTDVINAIKGTKTSITALTNVLEGSIAVTTDTHEFGFYVAGNWTWLSSSPGGTGRTYDLVFQTMGA